ncbi:MAG TPA: hypothetical protein VJU79_03590 [Candidatus Dormibacteraeota bacterium]|nr:hypothetical protein [Candidatus Dormibacteraeota bacterium]
MRLGKHSYDVGVSEADLAELAGGAPAEQLVRESFAFLLEREPPQSILSRFDLAVISRYFPDYRSEIARRMRDARGA